MKKTLAIFGFLAVILFNSCAQKNDKKDYVVKISTNYGDMYAILYDETPKHKENFIKLAKEKYLDSTLFHRVIQGFMIQGGDPNSKKALPGEPLGMGGPNYTVPAEFNPKFYHEKGALSAARLGDQQNPEKASSGSQFYIVQGTPMPESELIMDRNAMNQGLTSMYQNPIYKPFFDSLQTIYSSGDMKAYTDKLNASISRVEKATNLKIRKDYSPEQLKAYTEVGGAPFLDGQYTVFGKVIKGLEVIDKIAALPRDSGDRPVEDVRMFVTVEEMSKKKIEKEYGYKYPEK